MPATTLEPPPHPNRWIAWALGGAYAVVAALLALRLHPIVVNESESDNFVGGVESLLQGAPFLNTYHPAHLMLCGAALVKLFGCEPFTALRLVAAVGGGLVVAVTARLAERLGAGPRGAVLTALVTALHPGLLLLAMQAAADTLATALLLCTLLAGVRAHRTQRDRDALLCGLLFGLAVGTRFSCVGFAPALLLCWRRGHLVRRGLQVGAGIALGYAPHGIASTLQFGSPFHTDNWRNFVLKHGNFDPLLLVDPGYPNLFAFLREHWVESLRIGAADVAHQVGGDFGRALTGLPAPWSWLLGGVALLALAHLAWTRRWPGGVTGLCFASYLGLVCLSYAPIERVLLPLFPLALVALGALVRPGARPATALGAGTLAIVGIALACQLPTRLQRFVDAHPFREIEVARALDARPDVERLASTYADLPRLVPGTTYVYPVAPGPRGQDDPYAHLRRELQRDGANAFVLGRRTAADTWRAVRAATPPPDVRVLVADDDLIAVVFDVVHDDGDAATRWFAGFTATPTDWHGGPLDLEVELTATCDVTQVAAVAVRLELAPGKGPILDLPPRGERRWGITWPSRPPPGSWTIGSRLRLHDGRYVRGPRRTITAH